MTLAVWKLKARASGRLSHRGEIVPATAEEAAKILLLVYESPEFQHRFDEYATTRVLFSGTPAAVVALLDAGLPAENYGPSRRGWGYSLTHDAAAHGEEAHLNALAEKGLIPPEKASDLLPLAGSASAVRALIALGGKFVPGTDGEFPMHHAAKMGRLESVRAMLQAGHLVNVKSKSHITPLVKALTVRDVAWSVRAWSKHVDIVLALLAAGADPNLTDDLGRSPLMLVADRFKPAESGLDEGASVAWQIAEVLLDKGAAAAHQDSSGRSVFEAFRQSALKTSTKEQSDLLARLAAADPRYVGHEINGELESAFSMTEDRRSGNADHLLRLLLNKPGVRSYRFGLFNPSSEHGRDDTLLIRSARLGKLSTVRLLLEEGADVLEKNADARTAADVAREAVAIAESRPDPDPLLQDRQEIMRLLQSLEDRLLLQRQDQKRDATPVVVARTERDPPRQNDPRTESRNQRQQAQPATLVEVSRSMLAEARRRLEEAQRRGDLETAAKVLYTEIQPMELSLSVLMKGPADLQDASE